MSNGKLKMNPKKKMKIGDLIDLAESYVLDGITLSLTEMVTIWLDS